MKNSTFTLLLIVALGSTATAFPTRAQTGPQTLQSPAQAGQTRDQDRKDAESVTIGKDWKAQERDRDQAGRADESRDRETVGRDWRAHPDRPER